MNWREKLIFVLWAIIVVPSISNKYIKVLSHTVSGPYLRVVYQVKAPAWSVRMTVQGFDLNGNPVRTTTCDIVPTSIVYGSYGEETCIIPLTAVRVGLSL